MFNDLSPSARLHGALLSFSILVILVLVMLIAKPSTPKIEQYDKSIELTTYRRTLLTGTISQKHVWSVGETVSRLLQVDQVKAIEESPDAPMLIVRLLLTSLSTPLQFNTLDGKNRAETVDLSKIINRNLPQNLNLMVIDPDLKAEILNRGFTPGGCTTIWGREIRKEEIEAPAGKTIVQGENAAHFVLDRVKWGCGG